MKQPLQTTSHATGQAQPPAKRKLSPGAALNEYLTLRSLLNVLLVSVVLIEFYQPCSLLAEAGKKSKKYVVVKEIGTTYKKVPVYKKVPMKVLKVVIKKKKAEKPWKKWFKKEMIVKIPKEKKHHHHHHAASEGHQTWALPAFISTPSSMSEIFEAWPGDYAAPGGQAAAPGAPAPANKQHQAQPTSVADLKSVGSEEYPAFLAAAAAQLVQHQLGYPAAAANQQLQQQHQAAIGEHIALTNLANLEQALHTGQVAAAAAAGAGHAPALAPPNQGQQVARR